MSGKGIVSLVTGILSIMLCWTGYIGVVLGIVAIVFFGLVYKSKEKSGMAIAGLITGIIGTFISFIYAVFWTVIFGAVASAV